MSEDSKEQELVKLLEDLEGSILRKNLFILIKRLKSQFSKDYDKWFEYCQIAELVLAGQKPMKVYKLIAPNEEAKTVSKRFNRRKEELEMLGYDTESIDHIKKIRRIIGQILRLFHTRPDAQEFWIPVGERLPQEGRRVLVFTHYCKPIDVAFYNEGKWNLSPVEHGELDEEITHWMPFPKPPKAARGEGGSDL